METLKDLSEGYQSSAGKQVDWERWRGTRRGKIAEGVRGCWFQVSETERCNKGIHAIVQPSEDGLDPSEMGSSAWSHLNARGQSGGAEAEYL